MESLDNPSYFTLPASSPCRAPLSLLKRRGASVSSKMGAGPSSSSPSPSSSSSLLPQPRGSSSAPSTPTTAPPPPPLLSAAGPHRRSFRSLLRSVSASNPPHLLVLGEPRPSDVAPGLAAGRGARKTAASAELLGGDMVYCGAPPAAPAREPLSSSPEEVFLGRDDARYYNLSAGAAPQTGRRRRHSIGTYLGRERRPEAELTARMATTSVGDQSTDAAVPVVTASAEHVRSGHSRRRCNRCCITKGARMADMADILIVSSHQSQAAALWVSYLTTCFERFSNQCRKVLSVSLEEVVGPRAMPLALEEMMVHVKLQIVIVCPQFLEHVFQNPGPGTALGKLLQPDRVLAMLLGVTEENILEQHRAALMSYQQWCRMPVRDQDESFVGEFFEIATNMLARGQTVTHTDKAMFSLLPKKVKEGQNKVIVLLNEPITKEDKLKVSVDKNGERLAVAGVKRRNPYTLHFQMPSCCMEVSMLVSVYVEKNGEPLGSRQVKCESKMRELDQILRSWDNPLEFMCQTLGFSPADKEHLDNFLVGALQRNLPPHFNLLHTPMGQPHRQPSQTSSPEEYPTLLHFAAKFGLEKLAWQLLECPGGEQACDIRNACELTPAEIAEAAGHTKLANALRGYMQMTELTSMYSYLKIMSEGNHKTAVKDVSRATYQQPRPLNETYQVPPSIPRPVMDNYQVPPAARPFIPPTTLIPSDNGSDDAFTGYMEMHPTAPMNNPATLREQLRPSLDFLNTVATTVTSIPHSPSVVAGNNMTGVPRSPSPIPETQQTKSSSAHQLDQMSICSSRSDEERQLSIADSKKSQEQLSQGSQDELLEIINDFKDNVLTISEVEKLVECWRNRNDVQQSFKDKQEQLNQMREEYERIQREMKESMKKPTPFDRIRKIFKGKPKETKDSCVEISLPCPADVNKSTGVDSMPLYLRPVSSLSLQSSCSSSSSGRMSTVSGCSGISLGDSGTHSDTEERKQMLAVTYEEVRFDKGGISNYEIPPAPRPLFPTHRPLQKRLSPPRYVAAPTRLTAKSLSPAPEVQTENRPQHINIQDRPPQPIPRPDDSDEDGENYISVVDTEVEEGKSMSKPKEGDTSQGGCEAEYLCVLPDKGCNDAATCPTKDGDISSAKTCNQTAVTGQSILQNLPDSCWTESSSCKGRIVEGKNLTNGVPLFPFLNSESGNLRKYMNVSIPSEGNNKSAPPVPPRPLPNKKP